MIPNESNWGEKDFRFQGLRNSNSRKTCFVACSDRPRNKGQRGRMIMVLYALVVAVFESLRLGESEFLVSTLVTLRKEGVG